MFQAPAWPKMAQSRQNYTNFFGRANDISLPIPRAIKKSRDHIVILAFLVAPRIQEFLIFKAL